ncbi:MAG: hypothetical protein C0624_09025 [Desulfuromonas sp.]|nr:MAG: hypothetical protein C0624_09025 [Desulfuromonas sp.]
MRNARFTSEFGKEIFVLTFDVENPDDALPLIRECARKVQSRPKDSVLTLTVIKTGKFTPKLVTELQKLALGNKPYVHRAAMVGVTKLNEIAINAVSLFSKREFKVFEYEQTAINYLQSAEIGAHHRQVS